MTGPAFLRRSGKSRHTTPHHATPRHATPHHTTPHHTMPHHTTPHHTTPHHNHAAGCGCGGLNDSPLGRFCGYGNGEEMLGDAYTQSCESQCTAYLSGRPGCCRRKTNNAHCWVTVGSPPSVDVTAHSSSGFQAVMCNVEASNTPSGTAPAQYHTTLLSTTQTTKH